MKKTLVMAGALLASVAIPAAAFAATYQYVNVNGQLATEQAPDAATAMRVSDLAPHSGVILVTNSAEMSGTVTLTQNTDTWTNTQPKIVTNADGSITVYVAPGTHVHSDSDN